MAISALQSVLVAVVLAGVAAVVIVLRRRSRGGPVSPLMMVLAGALAIAAAVVVGFVASQVFSGSSRPIQLPPGGSLSVDGNAQTKNIACNDGHVKVDGACTYILLVAPHGTQQIATRHDGAGPVH